MSSVLCTDVDVVCPLLSSKHLQNGSVGEAMGIYIYIERYTRTYLYTYIHMHTYVKDTLRLRDTRQLTIFLVGLCASHQQCDFQGFAFPHRLVRILGDHPFTDYSLQWFEDLIFLELFSGSSSGQPMF